jgi:vitamin B12/bleomycin/antimicrobial peptide transport system ATP-binding/permease protein
VLSIGDMQKLAWARLFLAKPYFAFLDEATTAIDLELEAKFYKELQKFAKLWISIGLRDSLLQFHTKQLILQGNGEWQIK